MESLKGGDFCENVYGITIYQLTKSNPSLNGAFNKAMAGYAAIFTEKIIEKYKGFEGLTSLVDVGGGNGKTLGMIVAKYPTIKGLNFDLPHVVNVEPSYQGMPPNSFL